MTIHTTLGFGAVNVAYPFPSIAIAADVGGRFCTTTARVGAMSPVTTGPPTNATTVVSPPATSPRCAYRQLIPTWLRRVLTQVFGVVC